MTLSMLIAGIRAKLLHCHDSKNPLSAVFGVSSGALEGGGGSIVDYGTLTVVIYEKWKEDLNW